MKVEVVDDADLFLAAAEGMLLAHEAESNLVLGIAGTMRDEPHVYEDRAMWVVRDGGAVVGAALRTPPFDVVLARPLRPDAVDVLADAIDDVPGVVGAVPEVDRFAARWAEARGSSVRRVLEEAIFTLERVEPPPPVEGTRREAGWDDYEVLDEWYVAFAQEAIPGGPPGPDVRRRHTEHRIESDRAGFALWEVDGRVVSLCGYGGPTPTGIRIGPVFTPPQLRGRGYASALVADVSQGLLDAGRRLCFLYTDLANPTSNAIYERIGYRRVCDAAQLAFEPR
jgi:RimJ/RimL family protein N-acetyltransferase